MRIATFLITLLIAVPAVAGTRAGVTMPDSVTLGDTKLTLNGMGLREATMLKVDVYVAGLYVEHVSSNPSKIISSSEMKMIKLQFKRDVGRNDIVKAWNEGFAKNATVPVETLKPLIAQLNSWMPSFEKGDTLVFTVVPGRGVAVDINGTRKGVLGDDNFAKSLVSIWLGPKPPTGSLKSGMLGNHPNV
jgi:hypothetical protein